MILIIDNYDSFTYNLQDYFLQLNIDCNIVTNNITLNEIKNLDFEGLILSPGPETPEKAGNLLTIIDYYHNKIPILGICLGHQALGVYFGATLQKAKKPMHGKISEVILYEDPIFKNLPKTINVTRYHSLLLNSLSENLSIISNTNILEIMAFRHNSFPIWGIQFHPEAHLTEHGLNILKNWVSFNKIATELS